MRSVLWERSMLARPTHAVSLIKPESYRSRLFYGSKKGRPRRPDECDTSARYAKNFEGSSDAMRIRVQVKDRLTQLATGR